MGNTCVSPNTIFGYIVNKNFNVVMLNKYFELHNYDAPIQEYLTEYYSTDLAPGLLKRSYIFIKENAVRLMDNLFQFGSYKEHIFYSISQDRSDLAQSASVFFEGYLILDAEKTTYERTVYSLFSVLAQIGGVFGVIRPLLYIFLSYYVERMMEY
jgi:hypothetical protein